MIRVSIIIPVYRSAETLPKLVDQLSKVLDPRGEEYEIEERAKKKNLDKFPDLAELLSRCPGLAILATSRAALAEFVGGREDEIVFPRIWDLIEEVFYPPDAAGREAKQYLDRLAGGLARRHERERT